MPMHRYALGLSLAASTFLVAGCGGGGGKTETAPSSNFSGVTITITRQNGAQSFSPNPASAGGQQVVFKNADSITHRVALNDGSVDTGDIAPGATSRVVPLPASGTNYHCTIHPDMIGSVNPSSGGPPPECTSYCGGEPNPNDGY